MFIDRLCETSQELVEFSLYAHRKGRILPDSYVVDIGIIRENAQEILNRANANGIRLYYMLKQIGRNPLVARMLDDMGYDGAVAVDFNEALSYIKAGVRLAHVGNLVQMPDMAVERILAARPGIATVFSVEKAAKLNAAAQKLGMVQRIQLRIFDANGPCYPGQNGGFTLESLPQAVEEIKKLRNLSLSGVCAFPCFLCDAEGKKAAPTENVAAVLQARDYLNSQGVADLEVNLSSVSCCDTMARIADLGGNRAEPGHGLTGTTPLHQNPGQPERIGYLYLSEISHNIGGHSCCYGGGHYSRGHLKEALCGRGMERAPVSPVSNDNIDYYFDLEGEYPVGEPVIMCFRAQMFTARSRVVIVDSAAGRIYGTYNAIGGEIDY